MNLSAPTQPVFWISVILALLALIGMFVAIPFVSANAIWVALVAFALLLIGNVSSGL